MITRRRTILGILFLALIGACTLAWAISERQQSQQRAELALISLRQKIVKAQARAAQEEADRARQALDGVWYIVHDQSRPVWERLVDLAKVYHRGIYPYYKPDTDTGNALCRTIILHCPDLAIKNEARLLLFSAPTDPDDALDIHPHARNLPVEAAGILTKSAMNSIVPGRRMTRPGERTRAGPPVGGLHTRLQARPQPRPRAPRPDPQNVHDHGVARHVASILTSLPPAVDAASVRREVEDHIATSCGDHISDDDKAAALHILDSLRDEVDNPALGLSEQESLARVWAQAKHKDFVVQQLASGLEHGQPVCHSGKIARIAAALDDGESDAHRILPMWAIKEQLNGIAASVRERTLSEASSADVEAYHTDDESHLTHRMQEQFRGECDAFLKQSDLSPVVVRTVVDEIAEFGF